MLVLAIGNVLCAEVVDTSRSQHAVVESVGLEEVHWGDGFWGERFATCHERSLPAMWAIMRGSEYKPFLQHFQIAAGDRQGEYHGAQWNDGDFYKFLEACIAAWATTHDPALEAIVDQSIDAVGRAQRPDGYLHTPVLIRQRHGDPTARPFEDRHNFEMYNMGHLITTACLHHRVTGRDDLLAIAKQTANFLDEAFRNPTPELARNSVCPSHYMALVELYRTTREPRYLALAERFLDMRNLVTGGGDDNQDRLPLVEQREAVGHAVRANYLYAGAADVYLETGDAALRQPLDALWQNVVGRKMYITGACGALYDGASPDGSPKQAQISRVHQAYGRNYQLPNITAHNETCANIGNVLWNWRMFLATGEARYVDIVERALINAVLCGVSLEGTDYFYVNPLRQVDPLPTELRWSRTRVPFVTSYCCPPNVVRTLAEVNGYAYSKSAGAIWLNLYGASRLETELHGAPLVLSQQTEYPWDGRIRVSVSQCPADAFALKFRIPAWADEATFAINGKPHDVEAERSSYVELHRRWQAGDVVELHLPMPVQLIEAHPLVEAARNQVAIQRGPVVYCLESPDLPAGVRVGEVVVPAEAELAARYEPDLLGGVAVIEGEVLVRPAGSWEETLYRPLATTDERSIGARFIPYYAWANRGESEMSVWLPRD